MPRRRTPSRSKTQRSGAGEARVLRWGQRRRSRSCTPEVPVTSISATNKQSAHPLTCFRRMPKNAETTDAARAMNHSPFRTRADMGVA
jgi:hypothetical protein